MEAVSVVTQTMLPPQLSPRSPVKTLQMISTMLSYLLSVVLPLLIVHSKDDGKLAAQQLNMDAAVDQFLRRLALVYIPIIRSFAPSSRSFLWRVFSTDENSRKDNPLPGNGTSTIEELLSLLRTVSILDQVCSHAGSSFVDGLKGHLGLEVVRELEKAILQRSKDGSSYLQDGQTRPYSLEERVSLLATKDIVWYMCNILHLIFTPVSAPMRPFPIGTGQYIQDDLLKNGILKSFSDLIFHLRLCAKMDPQGSRGHNEIGTSDTSIKQGGRQLVDEVGYGMILAAAEKVWLHCADT